VLDDYTYVYIPGASGTVYNETLAEAFTPSVTQTASVLFANALAATLALSDAYGSAATFGNVLAEMVSVVYSVDSVVVTGSSYIPGAQVGRTTFESSRPVQAVTYRLDAIGGSRPEISGGTRSENTSKAKR
jgi:hypothetical protein